VIESHDTARILSKVETLSSSSTSAITGLTRSPLALLASLDCFALSLLLSFCRPAITTGCFALAHLFTQQIK
jgi:hypothetical protein